MINPTPEQLAAMAAYDALVNTIARRTNATATFLVILHENGLAEIACAGKLTSKETKEQVQSGLRKIIDQLESVQDLGGGICVPTPGPGSPDQN